MEKEKIITEKIARSADRVWEVVKKPSALALHGNNVSTTVISDLEWIEHTSEQVDNRCTATVDESSRTVTIKSESSKYKSEHDEISISVKGDDSGAEVTIDFTLYTGAIANILVFKFAGDKIMEGGVEKMMKHIEKHCK